MNMRKVFCVLSSKSLPYAEKGLASLFKNALEPLDITLITDALEDKQAIIEALSSIPLIPRIIPGRFSINAMRMNELRSSFDRLKISKYSAMGTLVGGS